MISQLIKEIQAAKLWAYYYHKDYMRQLYADWAKEACINAINMSILFTNSRNSLHRQCMEMFVNDCIRYLDKVYE